MNKEKEIVPNHPEIKKKPQKGHDAQLAEHIHKIFLGIKDPLPTVLSGQHPPDKSNASDDFPRFAQSVSKASKFSEALMHLETYGDMSRQLDRYITLLENAERHQRSVRPRTYEKVRNEYAKKKSSLQKARDEQCVLLQKKIQGFLQEQTRLEEVCKEKEDRIEEITFRVSVGELAEDEIQSEKKEVEQQLFNHRTDLEAISQILSRSMQIGLLEKDEAPDKRDDTDQGENVGGLIARRFWRRKK
jgi:hypothetical protein